VFSEVLRRTRHVGCVLCTSRGYKCKRELEEIGGTQIARRIARILFVEYHAAFRQAAAHLMDREADLEVVAQGASVAEGRRKMAEGGIDTAIVDIPLPDEGASEMVSELHQANPSVPVLVLTSIEDEGVREEFLEAGADEVLPKSITLEEFLAAVRRLGYEERQ
jgi:DNA-binding NarL/FixJ family response regulator